MTQEFMLPFWIMFGIGLLSLSFHLKVIVKVVQFSSFCNPVDCSTPGLPIHHQLPELTQTHVHGQKGLLGQMSEKMQNLISIEMVYSVF